MTSIQEKRKLIFLWTYTSWGGAQIYLHTIMKRAATSWDQVVILPRASKPNVTGLLDQFRIRHEFLENHFDPVEEPSIWGKLRRHFARLRSEAETYRHLRRYDLKESILHIEIGPWQSWVLLSLLAARGGNIFITLNNFRPDAARWRRLIWKSRFYALSRFRRIHIFASNEDAKESLREWLPTDRWRQIPVAYSPLDPAQISKVRENAPHRDVLRERFSVSPEDFVVLTVGQFVDRKGRWILLEAARKLALEDPTIRFIWLMPDPIAESDRPRVESYGLGDRFTPIVSSDVGVDRLDVLGFFRIADAFALPSYVEGLPISLIEAMALGLPAISTNVYAIPEAIIPEKTGILIEAGDADSLAAAILRVKSDKVLAQRLSVEGSRIAMSKFDANVMAQTYLRAYEQCFR